MVVSACMVNLMYVTACTVFMHIDNVSVDTGWMSRWILFSFNADCSHRYMLALPLLITLLHVLIVNRRTCDACWRNRCWSEPGASFCTGCRPWNGIPAFHGAINTEPDAQQQAHHGNLPVKLYHRRLLNKIFTYSWDVPLYHDAAVSGGRGSR